MDYSEVMPRIDSTENALRRALGHLTEHCSCRGESVCMPCELARDSWEESTRLRDLRARTAEFLEHVDHVLRCVNAYAATNGSDGACPVCAALAIEAQEARHD